MFTPLSLGFHFHYAKPASTSGSQSCRNSSRTQPMRKRESVKSAAGKPNSASANSGASRRSWNSQPSVSNVGAKCTPPRHNPFWCARSNEAPISGESAKRSRQSHRAAGIGPDRSQRRLLLHAGRAAARRTPGEPPRVTWLHTIAVIQIFYSKVRRPRCRLHLADDRPAPANADAPPRRNLRAPHRGGVKVVEHRKPKLVGNPATSKQSLIETGTP